MLNKKYTESKSMHTHLSFFTAENCKLGMKAFNNEFLTQVMLMSLPHNSTWEILVVMLLQSISDKNPPASVDVTSCLMQEYCCLASTDSTDTALVTSCGNNKFKSSKPPRPSGKRCEYCHNFGHTKDECQKKKNHEEQDAEGTLLIT
jgi:hypothetical protein